MNINEVNNDKSLKSESVKVQSNSFSKKTERRDFYSYVEVSSSQSTSDKKQQEENIQPAENNNEDNQKKELEEKITESIDDITAAYVQNLQTLNAELFDMGICNLKSGKNENVYEKYNIDLSQMTINDIKLFDGLTQKSDIAINSFNSQNQTFNMSLNGENLDISYKSIEVSKTLFTALENAAKTGKSVRLDFGQDTSVILKISKDGKLSADFVPNEKAMETVLKNALPLLKAKFDEENLPYKELTYRNFNQQQENNRNNNKEKNKDE